MAIQIFWEVKEKCTILTGDFNNLNFWMTGDSPVTKFKVVVFHVIIAYIYFLFLDNIIHVSIFRSS